MTRRLAAAAAVVGLVVVGLAALAGWYLGGDGDDASDAPLAAVLADRLEERVASARVALAGLALDPDVKAASSAGGVPQREDLRAAVTPRLREVDDLVVVLQQVTMIDPSGYALATTDSSGDAPMRATEATTQDDPAQPLLRVDGGEGTLLVAVPVVGPPAGSYLVGEVMVEDLLAGSRVVVLRDGPLVVGPPDAQVVVDAVARGPVADVVHVGDASRNVAVAPVVGTRLEILVVGAVASEDVREHRVLALTLLALALALGMVLLAWAVGRRLDRRVGRLADQAEALAAGVAPEPEFETAGRSQADRASRALVALSGRMADERSRRMTEAAELRQRATRDPLTMLANRATLFDQLETALARSRRSGRRVGVLFLDLDDFKAVNDGYGHRAGDSLLVTIARRVEATVRPSDVVSRFGGDEFVVLCEDLDDVADAAAVAERVLDAFSEPFPLGGDDVLLTASVGIGLAVGSDEPETVLDAADRAMYRAKELGKNRWALLEPVRSGGDPSGRRDRLPGEDALRQALDANELHLVWQPVIDLDVGGVVAVEALLRRRGASDPDRADDALALAADPASRRRLDDWVLREATVHGSRWRRQVERGPVVNVNVNPDPTTGDALSSRVRRILEESGLEPAALHLELPFATLRDCQEGLRSELDELAALGVGLVADDVPVDADPALADLPLAWIKLDGAPARGAGIPVVERAQQAGLAVVVERIESTADADRARELGGDLAQGHRYGRPVSTSTLGRRLGTLGEVVDVSPIDPDEGELT